MIANTEDVTWHNPLAAIWSNVEMNIAIVASCMPTIRCLFPRLLKATSLGGSHSYPMHSGDRSWGGVTAGSHHGRATFSKSPHSTVRGTGTHASSKHGRVNPYQSNGSDSTTGFGGKVKSHIRAQDSVDDIELRQHMPSPFPNGRIHVMTSIEQQEHQSKRSPDERDSTEDCLVKEKRPADCF